LIYTYSSKIFAPEKYWSLYELVDFEDNFRCWRFDHATTDERIIGLKRGTRGVSYLRKMLEVVLFPELWKVGTEL
jgi:tryptophan 2,3-dioxygenase